LIHRLVLENLKHRPVRTFLSALAIGVQVTMILTLVGLGRGVLGDMAARSRGTGADIFIRPPNSTVIAYSGNMPEKIVDVVRKVPHVAMATGTLMQSVGNFESIGGLHLDEFNAMSGGFHFMDGGPFKDPHDLMVDEPYAKQHKLKVGSEVNLGQPWRVCGIVESGKVSRMFADIKVLQDEYSATGKVSMIYVKLDDPQNLAAVEAVLKQTLDDYKIYSVDELAAGFSVDNVPLLQRFINIVIGLAIVIGFLVVFLSMYTAVLERTREIGILKALGASPGYIMSILLRETFVLAVVGALIGILLSYGSRQLMRIFAPTFTQLIVPDWWPYSTAIALIGAIIGAIYPGLKAARQDAIEALSYD
jgi:putative ABC transport system permease protein